MWDHPAFDYQYKLNERSVRLTVTRLLIGTSSEADIDDVCQRVWIEAWQHQLAGGVVVRAWLKDRAESRARDRKRSNLRHAKTFEQFPLDENSEPTHDPIDIARVRDDDPRIKDIWSAVHQLPDKLRCVMVMHYDQGIPQVEIAGYLGISQPAVAQRIAKAEDQIQAKLIYAKPQTVK